MINPVTQQDMHLSGRPPGTPAKTPVSSDFETFLRMLTTQMQNQNPLEPMEASDFAVQLATFSGVEQQVRTNELLARLATRQGLAEMAGWVGREALTPAPVHLDGAPRQLVPPEIDGADRAELVLTNAAGLEVGRYAVDPLATGISFEPPDPVALPPGHYQITMEGFRAGQSLGSHPVLSYARIHEARSDMGQILLVLEGGHFLDSSDVVGLRS